MNQKTILVLVAIVAVAGILAVAATIATPASALVREKDTRSNPNSNEIRSSQEVDKIGAPQLCSSSDGHESCG